MKKVLTMTLNPCIDRTEYYDSFQVGTTNIVKKAMEEAAGKGINVAVGLSHLNVPVKAMGFAYKDDLQKLYGKLKKEQIPYSFVEVDGSLRINRKLFDESKSEMTECNEKGTSVTKSDIDALLEALQTELVEACILVLSGSVPPGVSKDIYAQMTTMANEAGVKVILDASGELLLEGIKAKPYLIKPNREEFVKTFGTEEVECVAGELISNGLSYICVSLGKDGAMLVSKETDKLDDCQLSVKTQIQPAIPVDIRSLQGAGDAMVAGLCKAIYEGKEEKMLDYALTMASTTIALEGTQMGNIE